MTGVNEVALPEKYLPEYESRAVTCEEEEMSTCQEDFSDFEFICPEMRCTSGDKDGLHTIANEMRRRSKSPKLRDDGYSQNSAAWHCKSRNKKWTFRDIMPWIFFTAIFLTMIVLLSSWRQMLLGSGVNVTLALDELHHANRSLTKKCNMLEETVHMLERELSLFKNNIYNVCALDTIQEHNIKKVVDHSLAVYDADKTGLPDYALESAGGAVLDMPFRVTHFLLRCLRFLGFLKADHSPCDGPRCIIQPSVQPGNCWTFRGTRAKVKINLARQIHITAVTLEQTPANISISGDVTCAPKNFKVYGMVPGLGKSLIGLPLGSFKYEVAGPPLQTFKIQVGENDSTSIIQLSIINNHGHPKHTCVCRFRVHGKEVPDHSTTI